MNCFRSLAAAMNIDGNSTHRLNDGSIGYRRLAFLLNEFAERESR